MHYTFGFSTYKMLYRIPLPDLIHFNEGHPVVVDMKFIVRVSMYPLYYNYVVCPLESIICYMYKSSFL